jgi:hypothetical protein
VIGVVQCDTSPDGKLLGKMFGVQNLYSVPGGIRLPMALSSFDVVNPATLAALYGGAAPDPLGRESYLAALILRSPDLARTASVLAAAGIAATTPEPGRLVVSPDQTMGAVLEFRAQ